MEIRITKTGTEEVSGDRSDVINTYSFIENGKEFTLTCRSDLHGCRLGIAGKEGFLYTDRDDNTVRRQVVALGGACGLDIREELVDGLSSWAIRGVILADRIEEAKGITVTTSGPEGNPDEPVVLVDGKVTDVEQYVK